jgi:hypothetical protein
MKGVLPKQVSCQEPDCDRSMRRVTSAAMLYREEALYVTVRNFRSGARILVAT